MLDPSEAERQARLVNIVRESVWLMPALSAVRSLGLASWCIGAGAVRNLVWDTLHGYSTPSSLPDVDVAYFDATVLTPERDAELQAALTAIRPEFPWEVTNQAAVHVWFEACFGHAVAPLQSLQEGVASWPEYATAVGVTLCHDDTIGITAPHGLQDLFSMVIRHNPVRASVDNYRQRVEEKRYVQRWPQVSVVE